MSHGTENKANIIYWFAAGCLALLIAAVGWQAFGPSKAQTRYDVVVLGDSLMGLCRDETSIPALLAQELGSSVFNGAFGGTCMARNEADASDNYTMELLNMVSLAKAIEAEDFGVQQTVRSRREITDYFEETIDALDDIDFAQVQVLVLSFGLNDYHAGLPTDNAADPLDESTYAGALRSTIEGIQSKYPTLRIVLVTPTYAWYLSPKRTCEEYRTGDALLAAYVEKEQEVARAYGLECVDLYHGLYTHDEWTDWKTYTVDGLHPNAESRRRIAHILAEQIQQVR